MFPAAEVPLFRLTDASGQPFGTEDLWQRREMLIALVHPAGCEVCAGLLAELARRAGALHSDEIGVIVVSMRGQAPEVDGLRVLSDTEGRIEQALAKHGSFAPGEARLMAADRFGRLYGTEAVHGSDAEDVVIAVLDWLEFAQSRCEECGAALEWG